MGHTGRVYGIYPSTYSDLQENDPLKEIERKFILGVDLDYLIQATNTNDPLYDGLHGVYHGYHTITQHYLLDTGSWSIRVRKIERSVDYGEGTIVEADYVQTMKKRICSQSVIELEEQINKHYFDFLSSDRELTYPALVKNRHHFIYSGMKNLIWEVDQFLNPEYSDLVLAEVELKKIGEQIPIPFWVGQEVTGDKNFSNAYMSSTLVR
jgi:CYTH domain-containing protein